MKPLILSALLVVITSCATQKNEKPMPTIHSGKCSTAKHTINCEWQQIPDQNLSHRN